MPSVAQYSMVILKALLPGVWQEFRIVVYNITCIPKNMCKYAKYAQFILVMSNKGVYLCKMPMIASWPFPPIHSRLALPSSIIAGIYCPLWMCDFHFCVWMAILWSECFNNSKVMANLLTDNYSACLIGFSIESILHPNK